MPDVLAPVHHPVGSTEAPTLQGGTSFGTGIVTGALAAILGDLSNVGADPTPSKVQRAVRVGATDLDRGSLGKFDAGRTWDELVN